MKFSFAFPAAFAVAAAIASAAAAAPAKVGKAAPNATITTYDKKQVKIADLKGKVVVINHWATWCGPCKAEMPMMSNFHKRFKDKGFEIYGVTTQDSVPPRMLREVATALSYPLALRITGNGYPILKGLPTTYVIDRKGIVRHTKQGAFGTQEFIDLIVPLLNEPTA